MRKSVLSMIALLSGALAANADIYVTVDGAGNNDGTSWQNAKKGTELRGLLENPASLNEQTIFLGGGEYILVGEDDSRIKILGDGTSVFTLQGAESGTPTVIRMNKKPNTWTSRWQMFEIESTGIAFNNITFHGTNIDAQTEAAEKFILSKGADLTFNNCEIRYFYDKNSEGIIAVNDEKGASFLKFNHCYFHHNIFTQGVISCTGGQDHIAYLNDVRFEYNATIGDWGTEINWRKNLFVANSSFWGNSARSYNKASPMINATGTPVIINSSFYNCNNQATQGTIRTQRGLVMNNIILSSCNRKSFEVADNVKETKAYYNIYSGINGGLSVDATNQEVGKTIMMPAGHVLDVKSALTIAQKPTLEQIRTAVGEIAGGELFLTWLGDEFGKDALGNARDTGAVTPGARQTISGDILTKNADVYVAPEQRGNGDGSNFANAIGAAELYARLHETNSSLAGKNFKLCGGIFRFPYRVYMHADGDFSIEGGFGEDGNKSADATSVIYCDYNYLGGDSEMISMEKASQENNPTVILKGLTFDGGRNLWNNNQTRCLNISTVNPVIEDCRFTGWSFKNGTAAIETGPNMTIKNVTIDNCSGQRAIRSNWGGEWYLFADGLTVTNCRFISDWAAAVSLKGQGYINNALIHNNIYQGKDNGTGFAINADNHLFVANSTIDGTLTEEGKDGTNFRVIRAAGDGNVGKIINSVYLHNGDALADNCSSDGYNASSVKGTHETDVELQPNCFVAETYKPMVNFNTDKANRAAIETSAKGVGQHGQLFVAWLGDGIAKDIEGNARPEAGFHPGAYEFSALSTGMEGASMEEAVPVEYYDLNGIRLNGPTKGFNIVKMSDGSVRKMIL